MAKYVDKNHGEKASDARTAKRQRQLVNIPKVSVEALEIEALKYCIHHMIRAGGAIRIGVTRDQGAWAIGVYGDGPQPYTEYVKPTESLTEYLTDLGSFFEELAPQEQRP
jgi:hypothetical protein